MAKGKKREKEGKGRRIRIICSIKRTKKREKRRNIEGYSVDLQLEKGKREKGRKKRRIRT